MREATGAALEPLPATAHLLQPVIERAAHQPEWPVATYREAASPSRAHRRAAAARDRRRFAKAIAPVDVPARRGQAPTRFEHDEIIRSDTTLERIAAPPPSPAPPS